MEPRPSATGAAAARRFGRISAATTLLPIKAIEFGERQKKRGERSKKRRRKQFWTEKRNIFQTEVVSKAVYRHRGKLEAHPSTSMFSSNLTLFLRL